MSKKIPSRYRGFLFALVMTFFTSLIVSAIVISLRVGVTANFIHIWLSSFVVAWPVVVVTVLTIAPIINKLLNLFIEAE